MIWRVFASTPAGVFINVEPCTVLQARDFLLWSREKKEKKGKKEGIWKAWSVPASPSESSADMNILICRAEERKLNIHRSQPL